MNDGDGSVITVKNWHVLLTLITWLVVCTMAFANLRAQGDENERRIKELEQRPSVTLPQYQDGQAALERRLDRIEGKVDRLESAHH